VLLNLISKGFYAATRRKAEGNRGDCELITAWMGARLERLAGGLNRLGLFMMGWTPRRRHRCAKVEALSTT